jgi:antitoxin (DNA-binding transcriptional repressor) of toxin-antitoxin stability system
VVILDRGRPVAQITPVRAANEELRALAAAGLVRLPTARLPRGFLKRPLPRSRRSVVEALEAERADRL